MVKSGRVTRVKTSCAILSPGWMTMVALGVGVAVPGRDHQRPLVIRVDDAGPVAQHQPLAMSEAGAREDEAAPVRVADQYAEPRSDQHGGSLRGKEQGLVETGMEVEPRRR